MSWFRHKHHDHPHDILANLEVLVHIERRFGELENKIMAEIDDLNAKLDALVGTAQNIVTLVQQLRSTQGVPADQVSAAAAKLQPVLDELNAVLQG